MLDEVVYLWRIREGENLSTTQKKSLRMVEDRIKALRMINSIMAETHQDESLIKAEKFKQLYMDLNILINKAVDLDDPSLKKAMIMIKKYIKEAHLRKELHRLPVIYEKKYRALLWGSRKKLRELRAFQLDENSCISTEINDGQIIGILPKSWHSPAFRMKPVISSSCSSTCPASAYPWRPMSRSGSRLIRWRQRHSLISPTILLCT
jgi:hypothetical protein